MATIIWCDKVRHIVNESRGEVAARIAVAQANKRLATTQDARQVRDTAFRKELADDPEGFIYFTLENDHQRALNVNLISSFEAVPGDGI
jgi:hypothetical protein